MSWPHIQSLQLEEKLSLTHSHRCIVSEGACGPNVHTRGGACGSLPEPALGPGFTCGAHCTGVRPRASFSPELALWRQLGPDLHSGCGPCLTAKCPIPASFLAWPRTMRSSPCRSSQTEPVCPPGHSTVAAELRGDLLDVSCSSSEKVLSSSLRLSEWIAGQRDADREFSAASTMCSRPGRRDSAPLSHRAADSCDGQ